MNKARVIFHIDMNAFFASCEEIKRPYLKDKPFAVGVRYSSKGVLSTSNYIARSYGVKSAMSVKDALKKCPNLCILDCDYKFYQECSENFMNILYEYTDKIEQASIDEAFMDVTDVGIHPFELSKIIQKRILDEAKLPCSIGIAPTKFLAKMGSDMKKPMGITVVRIREIKDKIFPLDIGDMFGIGNRTSPKLREMGINTIGDLYNRLDELHEYLGDKRYIYVKNCLEGKSSNVVDPNRYSTFSSISNSRTSPHPLVEETEVMEFLIKIADIVNKRIERYKVKPHTLTVQIKNPDLRVTSRSKTFNNYVIGEEFYKEVRELFTELWDNTPVRLIGVGASNFEEDNVKQYDLFHLDEIEKEENLEKSLKDIEEKYGKNAIKKGIL